MNFDVNTITQHTRIDVEVHIKGRENSFRPEVIKRASTAVAPMAAWLKAVIEHSSKSSHVLYLSLIHISEPTRLLSISYAVFCLKKKKKKGGISSTYLVQKSQTLGL
eukprot:TRINITY_DN41669_c0_g1_i1.p2 TRINITY_DN41669_c0_g1~~TRINITY_DN41669_c0_g1_i1.p2  ORF type:complete len:107 (+),score=24.32 TRINITY_DN41669_c0_g1_i1:208-528(+)